TIDSWLTGKDYSLVPEKAEILGFSIDTAYEFQLEYKPKPRSKKTKQIFHAKEYPVRKRQAQGIRLTDREVIQLEVLHAQKANIINSPSAHGGGLLEAALKKHKK
ncbi:MAG: hypothetical protein ABFD82_08570, partial [Syntrophaceae bacterium]